MRGHIEQIARRLLRDGIVDNEVDAQLAAIRILAAASGPGDEVTATDEDEVETTGSRHFASSRAMTRFDPPRARRR